MNGRIWWEEDDKIFGGKFVRDARLVNISLPLDEPIMYGAPMIKVWHLLAIVALLALHSGESDTSIPRPGAL